MLEENHIKEPIGWKIKKYIDILLKKSKFKMTFERRIDILRKKGLKIGKNVKIDPAAKIDYNFCHLISIGNNCIICEGSIIMAHDGAIHPFTDDIGRAAKVEIKDNCIISANSIILPGVTIGPNVLVAAGYVVNTNVPPDSCVSGVPARFYGKFSDYISYHKKNIKNAEYLFKGLFHIEDPDELQKEKRIMIEEAEKGDIYYKAFKNEAEKRDFYIKTKNHD